MALNIRDLIAKLRVVYDKRSADQAEREVSRGFGRMEEGAKRIGKALIAAFAVERIVAFGRALIRTAIESEVPWNNLANTVENVGVRFASVERRIKLAARAMQDASTVGDEEFAETLDRLVALTGDFEGSMERMQLTADVAAKFFRGDLRQAAELVGRLMNGNTAILQRMGISVKDAQEGFERLTKATEGAASAAAQTRMGKWAQIMNDVGEAAESAGNAVLRMLSVATGSGSADIYLNRVRLALVGIADLLDRIAETPEDETKRLRAALEADDLRELRAAGLTPGRAPKRKTPEQVEEERKAAEEREKRLDAEIALLGTASELRQLGTSGVMRTLELEERFREELDGGNLTLERRVKLAERVAALMGIINAGGETGSAFAFMRPDSAPALARPSILPGDTRASRKLRTPMTGADLLLSDEAAERARDRLRDLEDAATNAAYGIAGAFQDMGEIILSEFGSLGEAAESLARGIAASLIGGVAQYASTKSAENIALAIEEVAKGLAAAANPLLALTAPLHFAAAKQHGVTAALWAALAGGAGAAQSAIGGGGRGGQSGGIPSGARDADARRLESDERQGPQIIIYVDGVDPSNPKHQKLIGQAGQKWTGTTEIRGRSSR